MDIREVAFNVVNRFRKPAGLDTNPRVADALVDEIERAIVACTIGDDLMREAWSLTNGDRHQAYGRAEDVFRAYGMIYTGLLAAKLKPGEVIDAADVAMLMTGLKLAREANKSKRDNVVDAHGYLSLLARIRGWIVRGEQ